MFFFEENHPQPCHVVAITSISGSSWFIEVLRFILSKYLFPSFFQSIDRCWGFRPDQMLESHSALRMGFFRTETFSNFSTFLPTLSGGPQHRLMVSHKTTQKYSTKRWVETNTSSIDVKVKYMKLHQTQTLLPVRTRKKHPKISQMFDVLDLQITWVPPTICPPDLLPKECLSSQILKHLIYQHRVKVKIQPNRIYIESNSFNILYSLIIFSFNLLLTWNPFVSSNLNSTWGLHRTKMLSR